MLVRGIILVYFTNWICYWTYWLQ